jgi:ribosomal protein L5
MWFEVADRSLVLKVVVHDRATKILNKAAKRLRGVTPMRAWIERARKEARSWQIRR